ncbi:MAG: EutN/CcmL family microcompartment protein [Deltaproteobacteria bacterium]|nr:EutN/CcmL family microcompartment protein [Deltaproteobacteria bacterium]
MKLAKVIGTVVATKKDAHIEGLKLLVVQDVNPETQGAGGHVVAIDAVGAGVGEYVLYASGSSARQTVMTKDRPCDAVIMAIVDSWEIGGKPLYDKNRYDHGYDQD